MTKSTLHPLSTEVNGKDWRITCTQKLTLAFALHAIESVKVVLFVHILERPGCRTTSMAVDISVWLFEDLSYHNVLNIDITTCNILA